jgi:hypothetical protein
MKSIRTGRIREEIKQRKTGENRTRHERSNKGKANDER